MKKGLTGARFGAAACVLGGLFGLGHFVTAAIVAGAVYGSCQLCCKDSCSK